VLGVHPIEVTQDFFDLGGHSLLAVRLLAQVEESFGKRLPLQTFLEGTTIERLATELRQHRSEASSPSLVPLKTGGSRPPFYCVHPDDGNVLRFRQLAAHLDPEQPVYALQAAGLDGQQPPYISVEQMAARYVREVQEVQPHGPYFLGGYCFGGLVALEMGHQLREEGEEVALIVMIDTSSPILMASLPRAVRLFERAYEIRDRVKANLRNLAALTPSHRLIYLRSKALRLKHRAWHAARERTSRDVSGQQRPFFDTHETIRNANVLAERKYSPPVTPGRLALFLVEHPDVLQRALRSRWMTIAVDGRLEIHEVPGDHYTMLRSPHVEVVAREVQSCLDGTSE
jgi:thioesterase domain-containing protein/acyl carrier protein